jgi:multicomponent Na+:H+ antiporter subunit D
VSLALNLVPLAVALPLALAAAMLAVAHLLPARVPDVLATLTALTVAGICAFLAVESERLGVLTYWFGGWTPRPGVVLGVAFGVDPASASIASFIGLLFAAALVFAWGYFDEVHAHFHVLMLLFLAAMVGFCLTRDLFNLFVWFEVMSVAAFALTAYRLEMPSLTGALNFTVANSIASFMMLGGVGLIYARAGALDFEALGHAVDRAGPDPVLIGAFCLLSAALMIKAAILPFHFWLSDAHAVAPSPVSVIFSGAMVSLGLFGLAKLTLQVFADSGQARFLVQDLFFALGAATAIVGALMTRSQRHLKRMLAFSTISHLGIMLTGLAALSATGLAGLLVYLVGHGLVKGALFMLVGVLMAECAKVDELDLFGRGRGLAPAGIAMAVAALLLAGAPWGLLDAGTRFVHEAGRSAYGGWFAAVLLIGSALTGATVLRATGRIFLGLGSAPNPEETASPSDDEQEQSSRPLWLMMAPIIVLLALCLLPGSLAEAIAPRFVSMFATVFAEHGQGAAVGSSSTTLAWASTALAVGIATFDLARDRLSRALTGAIDAVADLPYRVLDPLHSGLVGDYVVWIALGLACFTVTLAFS